MMPKGVEHTLWTKQPNLSKPVSLPMMPKGVEHISDAVQVAGADKGESSDDAERR